MQCDFWEKNAAQWNQVVGTGIFKSRQITNAAILNEIKRHDLKSLLDVGCGEGWIAGALDLQQCDYYGIDGSQALIEIAHEKTKASFKRVTYGDFIRGVWKPHRQFDGIIFNFSLLEENIAELLGATAEFLKPSGSIMIQTLHPCFALNKYRSGWNKEDFKTSGIQFSSEMPWYGRTLSAWIQVFDGCGLSIKEVREPLHEEKPASIIFILKISSR